MKITPVKALVQVVALFYLLSLTNADGQCSVGFVFQTASTNKDKCGYNGYLNPDTNGIDHYFLTFVDSDSGSYGYDDGDGDVQNGTLTATFNWYTDPLSCLETSNFNGTASGNYEDCDTDSSFEANTIAPPPAFQTITTYSDDSTDTNINYYTVWEYGDGGLGPPEPSNFLPYTSDAILTGTTTMTTDFTSWSETDPIGSGTYSDTATLSVEYTDSMLAGIINGLIQMPSPPMLSSNMTAIASKAAYSLDSTHVIGNGTEMQYCLAVTCSVKNATYHIQYVQIQKGPTNNIISQTTMNGTVTGTGDPVNPALGDLITVPVPSIPSTIDEEDAVVTKVDMPPSSSDSASTVPAPGSGNNN